MKAGPATSRPAPPVPVSRRRVLARTRLDFWLDAALLAAYTLAYSLGFTGIAAHEWLGIGLGAALLVHLTLHWDWVTRTTGRLLRRDGRERFIWLVNLLLLVSMTLCVASGILISEVALPQLGVSVPASSFWRQVHDTTASLTLILVPVHAALRWRWIAGVARRLLAWRPGRRSR
jgi:cytochrome b